MKKKILLWILAIFTIVVIIGVIVKPEKKFSGMSIIVYKSLTCGCCEGYVEELKGAGFKVDLRIMESLQEIKQSYNIPKGMESCHTSIIGDYFIEGHVPLEAVSKLLDEKPEIDGIILAGMPPGSPGMSGIKQGQFTVYSIKDGELSEFLIL